MFSRLRNKFPNKGQQNEVVAESQPKQEHQGEQKDESASAVGFICPMCMTSLPGPEELQIHFEKVHNEQDGGDDEKVQVDDETDALPDRSQEESLLNSPPSEFKGGHLELSLDSNAPDVEKELLLLQQELAEMNSQLKEEKWYSGQLKAELDKVSKERDKLEEDKQMVEQEFSAQLRSAEEGYLTVATENEELKKELTYADYNTTKERQEKLKIEMITYKNQLDEEQQRREAMEESFRLLQNDYDEEKRKSAKTMEQLQERPSTDIMDGLNKKNEHLNEEIRHLKQSHQSEVSTLTDSMRVEKEKAVAENTSLQSTIKEISMEKKSKDEQIASLQTAVSSSTDSSNILREQLNEKQQQFFELQHSLSRIENSNKEKDASNAQMEIEKNELKVAVATETSTKEKLEMELHTHKTNIEEMQHQHNNLKTNVKDLETSVQKEKDEVVRLEKERIELIAKIDAGEGTDTVIHQLSLEKEKLLETVSSMEKSSSEQMKQHSNELEFLRKEKLGVSEELHLSNASLNKLQAFSQDVEKKYEVAQETISNLKKDLKEKSDACFKLESEYANERNAMKKNIEELTTVKTSQQIELKVLDEKLKQTLENLSKSDTNQTQQASWIETKNNAIAEMTSRMSSYKEQLSQKTSQLEEKIVELQNLKESNERTVGENATEIATLKEGIAKITEDLSDKESVLTQMTAEKEGLEKVEASLLQRKDEFSIEIESLKGEILNLKEANTSFKIEQEKVVGEMQLKHDELSASSSTDLARVTNELQNQLHNQQSKYDDLQKNMENEIQKRSEADNEILTWETKYSKLESSLEQKDEILNEIQNKLEVAEKELKKPCDSCSNYEVQLCRLQEATRDQSGQIADLKTQMGQLEKDLNASKQEHEGTKQEFEQTNKEHVETGNELKLKIETLGNEKQNSEDEVSKAYQQIEQINDKVNSLQDEKGTLEDSLAKTNELYGQSQKEKASLEAEMVELKEELESQIGVVKLVEEEIKEMRDEMEKQKSLFQKQIVDLKDQIQKEGEAHEISQQAAIGIQEMLKEETVKQKNKHEDAMNECEQMRQSKVDLETSLKKEIDSLKENLKKQVQEISSKERRIVEYDMKVKALENEGNDLKGDVTVLEAQIQNSNEEKKALLERLLQADEHHKKTKQKLSDANRKLDQALSGLQELGQENQNIQVQQARKSNRQWENDKDVNTCKKCEKDFSLTIRKHHCRNCGFIFCKECSAWSAIVAASKKPVRVCESCSHELNNIRGSNVRRLSTTSIQSAASTR